LNVGNWASPNAIASQQAAAQRWGAQYHEFTRPWCIGTDPADVFAAKFDLHLLPFAQPCRVVWLDADVIVRADCPSLFDLVPANAIGGVLNNQCEGDDGELQDRVARDYWQQLYRRFDGSDCEDPHPYGPSRYINGGVIVFTLPDHNGAFFFSRCWLKHGIITKPVNPMIEQTALNRAIAYPAPIHILPATFNRLGKEAWLSGPAMTSHIYHFANLGDLCGDKRGKLEAIDWRVVP
jgi:hypothetical protein